jgi:hypothetical protein
MNDPAQHIIKQFGGLSAVSKIVGITPGQVQRWRMSKAKGGTGGTVPFKHVPALIKAAPRHGFRLKADDFLPAPSSERATA